MRLDPADRCRPGLRGLPRARRPSVVRGFDALERRSLLATLGITGGELRFASTVPATSNNLAVSVGAGSVYTVTDSGETITLDSALITLGWTVDGTGHVATGPRGNAFSSIAIDPVDGTDTVAIRSTDVPIVITPSGADTLTAILGNSGITRDVAGSVAISNPGGTTTIRVDDSADPTGAQIHLLAANSGGLLGILSGLTALPISYHADQPVTLQLLGGGGDDTLTVDFAAGNPLLVNGVRFDGGAGDNTLNLQNGSFATETQSANGPGAGSVGLNGRFLSFSNLKPVNDTVAATDFFFNLSGGLTTDVTDGPTVNGFATDQISSGDSPSTFELVNFANKANVFIEPPDGPTPLVFNLNAPTAASGLASLIWVGGSLNDVINLFASPAGVNTALNGGDGDDVFNVYAPGLGSGGTDFIDGGTGTNELNVNAGGRGVNASVQGQVAIGGAPTLVYTFIVAVNVINAADFPLTPIPRVVSAVEGIPLTGATVGSFTDADPSATVGLYTAGIDWGDGTPATIGTVVAQAGGGFSVLGSHTYARASTFPITIGVLDAPNTYFVQFDGTLVTVTDLGGSTTIHSTAVVASAPLTGQGVPVSGVEGVPLTAPVATFTSTNSEATAASYIAAIDWGDGMTPSAGTITLSGGVFTVTGSHLYENHGTYPVTVFVGSSFRPGVLATFTTTATIATDLVVRNTNDSGRGSLRYVIDAFDAGGVGGTIRFAIPGPGPFVIHLASPLSPIVVPALVDGTTQPGFAGSPIIEVDGAAAGAGDGLVLQAAGAGIRSLAIGGFTQGVGVAIQGPGGDFVLDSWIGTDLTGAAALPNFQGLLILGSSLNTIRGDVISGNLSAGVQILDDLNVTDPTVTFPAPPGHATGNLLEGNRIGTNAAGSGPLGNQQGVFINDASGNILRGNIISANRSIGVQILGNQATGNFVIGNAIGTDATGTARLGNSIGVFIFARPGNSVAANAIAFNTRAGVQVRRLADGPEVQGVTFLSDSSGNLTGAVLTFTNYLDRTRAQDPRNYTLTIPGRRFVPGTPIAIGQPVYNGVNRTVTLTFGRTIPAGAEIRLQVNGQRPIGLTDQDGNPLDGASTLPNRAGGSNFIAYYQRGVRINPTQAGAASAAGMIVRASDRRHPAGPATF
jgi:hypothetical protein